MYLTIEKVAILRVVKLFAGLPDYVLASIAGIMTELDLEPGVTFITVGTQEMCMYIISEGEVRVHAHGKTLATLPKGSVVGEFEILDSLARSANVTTTTPTRLLRLDKEPFDEIMEEYPEISQAIIKVLVERIREANIRFISQVEAAAAQ